MRTTFFTILLLAATGGGTPLANNVEHLLGILPRQTNIICPTTPNPMPKAAAFPSVKTMPDPFLYLDGKTRVQSKDEWLQCRQPEILKLLQEYQYGYYPDHSQETVSATRSSNTLTVSVAAGGKTASIAASLNLPSGSGPFPVVISIGGMDTKSYTNAGIAVVTFDYTKVAADSSSKSGSFWTLYNGKDIGV
ncbi:carbohydrate esterase family 15 protein [Alternaria alternata]|nr:carbohydrate esterase family 15 protein [Alternaria alternata]